MNRVCPQIGEIRASGYGVRVIEYRGEFLDPGYGLIRVTGMRVRVQVEGEKHTDETFGVLSPVLIKGLNHRVR